jgi:retron-type reverse transcriptase
MVNEISLARKEVKKVRLFFQKAPFLLLIYKTSSSLGFDEISVKGIATSAKCKPANRVYISKPHGKKRQLGIPFFRYKLLKVPFENKFTDLSHGVRKGRSCHSALQAMARKWKRTVWLIEADFVEAFDNENHNNAGYINFMDKNIQPVKVLYLAYR